MTDLEDYVMPESYGTTIGKCLTFGEIEALLAAERERCAKVAEEVHLFRPYASAKQSGVVIASAIRNLPPQTDGGQP